MTKQNYLTLPETARLFGVSVTTIRNWMKAGLDSYPFKSEKARSGYGFIIAEVAEFKKNKIDRRKKKCKT